MLTVILAIVALADYVITFYFILNMITKPGAKAGEEDPIMDDKAFYDYIEEQNIRIARLSFNIDKILSNIDAIIEKSKEERKVLSG